MFRENIRMNEVKISHELSGKINTRKSEKICRIENEFSIDSKVEMKYAG
jgi:hypothetical protein